MNATGDGSVDGAVTRRVLTARPLAAASLARLDRDWDDPSGIQRVSGRPGAGHLKVRYDATRTDYRSVCHRIAGFGVAIRNGRWPRLLAAWYDLLDTNLRENAAAPGGACCNRPPRRRR